MFLAGLVSFFVSSFAVWQREHSARVDAEGRLKQIENQIPQLIIRGALFDTNGPTEFYIDFRISNPSHPTIVRAWRLLIDTPKSRNPILIEPRLISTNKPQDHRAPPAPEDMSMTPLEQGGTRDGRITFSFSMSAKNIIGERDVKFELIAEDVKGLFTPEHVVAGLVT